MPVIQAMFYVLLGLGSICVFGLMMPIKLAPGKEGQTFKHIRPGAGSKHSNQTIQPS